MLKDFIIDNSNFLSENINRIMAALISVPILEIYSEAGVRMS